MHDNRYILDGKKQALREQVMEMSKRTQESLRQALNCVAHFDAESAQAIIDGDGDLNRIHHATENLGIFAIASQQPVAHDLREIVVAMRVGAELERIGDYAANIATILIAMDRQDLAGYALEEVQAIGGEVITMLDTVMQAYSELDIDTAKSIESMEEDIDRAVSPLTQKLFDAMKADSTMVEDASRMLWITHAFERVADRATNIAEQVIYAVTAHEKSLNH